MHIKEALPRTLEADHDEVLQGHDPPPLLSSLRILGNNSVEKAN